MSIKEHLHPKPTTALPYQALLEEDFGRTKTRKARRLVVCNAANGKRDNYPVSQLEKVYRRRPSKGLFAILSIGLEHSWASATFTASWIGRQWTLLGKKRIKTSCSCDDGYLDLFVVVSLSRDRNRMDPVDGLTNSARACKPRFRMIPHRGKKLGLPSTS